MHTQAVDINHAPVTHRPRKTRSAPRTDCRPTSTA